MNKSFLAIIPARGNSKRLPNKNILKMNGKPLISWTIEAAKKSDYLNKIIVSSENDTILKISEELNVNIIKRPQELAYDSTTTVDTIIHTIKKQKESYEYIVLLQATSPLRNEKHIDEAINLLKEKNADAIISVCECEHSPLWSNKIEDNLSMSNFLKKEILNKRSQDLNKYYRLNGAIYICKIEKFLKNKSFFLNQNIFAYKMGKKYSIDIDEEIDFFIAEQLMKYDNKK